MDCHNRLLELIRKKKSKIGIIGCGYVGLPLALAFGKEEFIVTGFDVDTNKVMSINEGKSYIKHIDSSAMTKLVDEGYLKATSDFKHIESMDCIIICVPTPLNNYREPNLEFIDNTLESIIPYLKEGQLICLESTTYPGTTREKILPRLSSKNLRAGESVFIVYSPEREDPGNKKFATQTIPKVVGGITDKCRKAGEELYKQIIEEIVPVSCTEAAEMTKLLENIHRAVNIGLMNELKPLCERMGIDIYEIIRAAATKPFGFVPYYPGPGLGGHCIPIDPFYLTWKAREYGMHTHFIELAGEINSAMPSYVVEKTTNALNNISKPLKGSKILILGIAYKKNIDDMRESPSVELMELFSGKGAHIAYSDPFFPDFPKMRNHQFELQSTPITTKTLSSFDAVILATDHDSFDYDLIKEECKLIIDTRGKFTPNKKIIRA